MQSDSGEALVTATFSRRMNLRLDDGRDVAGRVKGKKLRPVCGDRVLAEPLSNEPEWLITEILPRMNTLARPDSRGRTETLAANLDSLAVMSADHPAADWFIVDRYLSAAELMQIPAAVIFNKSDLGDPSGSSAAALANYATIGYPTVSCSAKTGANVDQVQDLFRDRTVIIVGQSGVGKSSLINRLVEDAAQRTAELSGQRGEGRHTTVNSVMLPLPGSGAVIDSPGVRDYAPPAQTFDEVILGFREIREIGGDCRFADCRHLREPDCAVKAAVEQGRIDGRRYESYKRLLNLARQLADKT